MIRYVLFYIVLVSNFHQLKADKWINFNNVESLKQISGDNFYYYEDSLNQYELEDILKITTFKQANGSVPNLGLSQSSFWIKLNISNNTSKNNLLLELAHPTTDYVDFYQLDEKNQILYEEHLGEYKKFNKRKYKTPNYLFDLILDEKQKGIVYLKVKSRENIQLPIYIGTPKKIFEGLTISGMYSGLYVGLMLIMVFYNLFIFISVRDKSYLYYVIYIVIILITQTSLQGYPFQFLWPNSPWLATHSLFIWPILVGVAFNEFSKIFLQFKSKLPKLYWITHIFNISYFIAAILMFTKKYAVSYKLIEITALLISFFMLFSAAKLYKKGYRPAKFYLFAWGLFLAGVIVFVLKDFGVLPYNYFTRYIMQIGSALEAIIISLALADRINILKREKEESDQKQLEALQENERIVREQNVILETKVENRTEELRGALSDLRNAQSQLVDSEKMASLGQLTAGIAHEINNPINFVTSNVNPLKQDIDDIISILDIYHEASELTGDEQTSKLKEAKELEEDLELDYIKKEMTQLLSGIDEGASRTAEIVRGLRTFSRLDENELKTADINEGLKSTLVILNTNINQEKIILDTSYAEIPEIECFPGKLNQVFMNIITNGIQATQKNPEQGKERKISVVTRLTDQDIEIKISDNGKGMSEEVKSKIFDPFYTTKDVGEGTGLGLSIAYSIINDHQGKISVESTQGVGSDFIIKIPIPKEQ